MRYLCMYHDMDGDVRGWPYPSKEHEPDICCQACRWDSIRLTARGLKGYFSIEDILEFEKDTDQWRPTWEMAQQFGTGTALLEALRKKIQKDRERDAYWSY